MSALDDTMMVTSEVLLPCCPKDFNLVEVLKTRAKLGTHYSTEPEPW